MPRNHGRKRQAVSGIAMVRLEGDEIAVIDQLAAGLTTGIEGRLAPRTLAMQRQQAVADLFFASGLIPKSVKVSEAVLARS